MGRPESGALIVRHMLPAPAFSEAIQRIEVPGTEREVLGPYYPEGEYTSTAAVEALGCVSG
jgi:hypothetical protein